MFAGNAPGNSCEELLRLQHQRGNKDKGRQRDLAISKARRDLDWDAQFALALYGNEARKIREARQPSLADTCTMCGSFCALRNANIHFQTALAQGIKK